MKVREKYGTILDDFFADFPMSGDGWRLKCDGWQHIMGTTIQRDKFLRGFDAAFMCINECLRRETFSPSLLVSLYRNAYQFEDMYEEYQKGFRADLTGNFEINLPNPQFPNSGGISEEGLKELVDNLIEAHLYNKSDDEKSQQNPLWQIGFNGYEKPYAEFDQSDGKSFEKYVILLDLEKFRKESDYDRPAIAEFLQERLIERAMDDLHGEKKHEIYICYKNLSKDSINKFVSSELLLFEKKVNSIPPKDEKREEKILEAIAKLIRKFHQMHIFPDGNGRTLIFNLKNFLLKKYLNRWAFTMRPTHFEGHSTRELVDEMRKEIAMFEEFKITRAREFVSSLELKDFLKPLDIMDNLKLQLSASPIAALAQINELFLRINEGSIDITKLSTASPAIFETPKQNPKMTMLIMLKQLYLEKINELVALGKVSEEKDRQSRPSAIPVEYNKILDQESFESIIEKHRIIFDSALPCHLAETAAKNLLDLIKPKIAEYPYLKPEKYSFEIAECLTEFDQTKKPEPPAAHA